MTCCPQLATVPGVSPLVCASLRGQNDAAVAAKPINILSFMGFEPLTALVTCETQSWSDLLAPSLWMGNFHVSWGTAAESYANGSLVWPFAVFHHDTPV